MDILDVLKARLTELLTERQATDEAMEAVLAHVGEEQRSDLNDAEEAQWTELRGKLVNLDEQAGSVKQRIADIESARNAAQAANETFRSLNIPRGGAVVTAEPPVYSRRGQHSFFRDMLYRLDDPDAADRIARNQRAMAELEQRAGTTANFAGLTPPQYLLDLFAPFLHAGRVSANLVRSVPLPAVGTSFNLGRGTTAAAVGVQATENATLSNADYDDTLLTFNLATLGGYADLSRQEIERGVGTDQIVMQDLAALYANLINSQVLNGSGSSGQMKGILNATGTNAVTYTQASPTVALTFPKLADAIQQINTNRLMPATAIVMHPRRWGWFTAALDSASRPLVNVNGPAFGVPGESVGLNPLGEGVAAGVQAPVGVLMGLPVYTDPTVPTNLGAGTNQDPIIIGRWDDALLMEETGAPIRVRYEEPGANSLTIRLVAYGYAAFTAERYANAFSIINGTGLVTPTF